MKKIFLVLLLVGCEKKSDPVQSPKILPETNQKVIINNSQAELDIAEYHKRSAADNPEFKYKHYEGYMQSQKGVKILENIENMIRSEDDDFMKYYNEAIEIDPGTLGVKAMVERRGLYSELCKSIALTILDSKLQHKVKHSDWEKGMGLKIYQLLKRVDRLPDTPEFIDAKIRIFHCASTKKFRGRTPEDENNDVDNVFYSKNRENALNYFMQFENKN